MGKPRFEVADIFREHGDDYRKKWDRAMSREQRRVMRAIEICRTSMLGGHVDECDSCGHQVISYNSCRNRHCPKCQSLAKAKWLEARRSEILPVEYYHLVFTVSNLLASLALQNKRLFYNILFHATSKTLMTIASDPKHLGAQIGFLAVLHTWGQKLMHHPHLHCVVPGGGLSHDGQRWISCRAGFFLPVRVLSRLFRRLFIEMLEKTFDQGKLEFEGKIKRLSDPAVFAKLLWSCRETEWVVYSKPPFGGPEKVLDYLGRYTHRIAISNHRLLGMKDGKVTFTWKNYKAGGHRQTLTLDAKEFIRRFLLHVLPNGFVRIRYYGLLANSHRAEKLRLCRQLLNASEKMPEMGREEVDENHDWLDLFMSLTGKDPLECPECKRGRLVRFRTLAPDQTEHTTHFPLRSKEPPSTNSP